MKKLLVAACVGILAALWAAIGVRRVATAAVAPDAKAAAQPMGKLIVHEWGTFTGFAGSDGVHLPFNVTIGSDLPPFVMNRQTQAAKGNPKLAQQIKIMKAFTKGGGAPALQRMETPVVYFYADGPGDVSVRVDFPRGLLTEFYPPVRDMGPKYGAAYGEFALLDPTAPDAPQTRPASEPPPESFVDWGRVRIIPHPTADEGKLVPAITNGHHYAFARDTDSALVQYADADGSRHEEKFLFYRGLGNFALPVTLIAEGGDRFELKNATAAPIHTAFLFQIDGGTSPSTRFARFDNINGNQRLTLPPMSARQDDLAEAIVSSLVADGLYEKEARAMVRTWKSTWLDEPGTRLLYLVPRPVTDDMLPLRVQPAPDQTVRVLVGRIDILTPEQESKIRTIMATADTTGNVSNDDAGMLAALGRFQTPALQRMSNLAGQPGPRQVQRLTQALSRPVASRDATPASNK